jgi:hypothetical protein
MDALHGSDPEKPGKINPENFSGDQLPKSAPERFHKLQLNLMAMAMKMLSFNLFYRSRAVKKPVKAKPKTRALVRSKTRRS